MEMSTWVTTVQIVRMVRGSLSGLMVIRTRGNFVKICVRVLERCIGVMGVLTRGSGKGVCPMVKVLIYLSKLGMFKAKG